MNSSSSSDQNTVDRLAEEFVARHRRGEHPAISEYTEQFPQHAEAICDLFPALALIEQVDTWLCDTVTGKTLCAFETSPFNDVCSLAFSPDGQMLASAGKEQNVAL
jgi:hypothetical protein